MEGSFALVPIGSGAESDQATFVQHLAALFSLYAAPDNAFAAIIATELNWSQRGKGRKRLWLEEGKRH